MNKHTKGPFITARCTLDSLGSAIARWKGFEKVAAIGVAGDPLPQPIALMFLPKNEGQSGKAMAEELLANMNLFGASPDLLAVAELGIKMRDVQSHYSKYPSPDNLKILEQVQREFDHKAGLVIKKVRGGS